MSPAGSGIRPWLVAAVSGRMLASSAARGGHPVVVLDCFADRDTRDAAVAARAVAAAGAPRLDRRALLRAAAELAPPAASAGLVCGSGFEGRTALLGALAHGRDLAGNPPPVVEAVKDPARLFPLLERCGAAHPEVRPTAPPDPQGWILKRIGGAGGAHIQPATRRPAPRGAYFQRLEPGRTLSVLFLADGRRARRIGCNEQWTAPHPGAPFLYGGAVGAVALPPAVLAALDDLLDALAPSVGLVGLNGLDFLLQGERLSVLEVNPRPTATLELYDPDWDTGLFDRHLRACRGALPSRVPPPACARAAATVLAPVGWTPTPTYGFPPWCRDLPMPGLSFARHDPVCTVHAEAATAEQATAEVHRRRQELLEAILAGQSVAAGP